jgi:hypothetical protein
MGVTTAQEAEAYETAKAARVSCHRTTVIPVLTIQAGYRPLIPRMDVLPTGARANAGQHRFLHGTGTPTSKHGDSREVTPRIPGQPGRKPRKLSPHRPRVQLIIQLPHSISPMPLRSNCCPLMNNNCALLFEYFHVHTS